MKRRTQSSVAVSSDGERWTLLNCSPDIREQIGANDRLWPSRAVRHSPISNIILTNADVDHAGGLLSLREGWPFGLFATAAVTEVLRRNPMFKVLSQELVHWRELTPRDPFPIAEGLEAEAFPVPGKVPLYMEEGEPPTGLLDESTIGLSLRSVGGKHVVYIPGCAAIDHDLRARIDGADVLFFDGTVFRDDEMIREGVGRKTGRRMGHMPIGGADGSLEALAGIDVGRRIYIHINNTNPVLIADSPERRTVEAAGWEVAEDGLELAL